MKGLYEHAVLPKPFTICGRHLKPFSFGHFIILRRFDVGFVSDEEARLTLEDIVFSLFVCSQTYEECEEKLYSGQWHLEVTEWGKHVWQQIKSSVPKGKTVEDVYLDFGDLASRFHEYIGYHTVRPYFKAKKTTDEGVEANAEWYEGIIKTLMGKCNYSHCEVMNLCFARALYEYLSYKEQQGEITFLNERQEKQLLSILKMKQEAKANGTR